MVPFKTSYLKMYWSDLHQIFRIGIHTGGHDHSDLLLAIAEGTLRSFVRSFFAGRGPAYSGPQR